MFLPCWIIFRMIVLSNCNSGFHFPSSQFKKFFSPHFNPVGRFLYIPPYWWNPHSSFCKTSDLEANRIPSTCLISLPFGILLPVKLHPRIQGFKNSTEVSGPLSPIWRGCLGLGLGHIGCSHLCTYSHFTDCCWYYYADHQITMHFLISTEKNNSLRTFRESSCAQDTKSFVLIASNLPHSWDYNLSRPIFFLVL